MVFQLTSSWNHRSTHHHAATGRSSTTAANPRRSSSLSVRVASNPYSSSSHAHHASQQGLLVVFMGAVSVVVLVMLVLMTGLLTDESQARAPTQHTRGGAVASSNAIPVRPGPPRAWTLPSLLEEGTTEETKQLSFSSFYRYSPLNIHKDSMETCTTFRVRGHSNTTHSLSSEQAAAYFAEMAYSKTSSPPNATHPLTLALSLGMEWVEHAGDGFFVSFQLEHMHFFHFLEFAVVAFSEWVFLQRYLWARNIQAHLTPKWMYHPYMTPYEICGPAGGINCLVWWLVFSSGQAYDDVTKTTSTPQEKSPQYKDKSEIVNAADSISQEELDQRVLNHARHMAMGLESNDPYLLKLDKVCAGDRTQWPGSPTDWKPASSEIQQTRHVALQQQVDAALLVDRMQCHKEDPSFLNKMWMGYVDKFPSEDWHRSVQASLRPRGSEEPTTSLSSLSSSRMKVCYMDRQVWGRGLPDNFHQWIVEYFPTRSETMEFCHWKMEDYGPVTQMRMASTCHFMLGAHGNALSHQFWMQPGSFVVEIFSGFVYKFDYATIAELMRHEYLALSEGKPLKTSQILQHDIHLPDELEQQIAVGTEEQRTENLEREGKAAIREFADRAYQDWKNRRERLQEKRNKR